MLSVSCCWLGLLAADISADPVPPYALLLIRVRYPPRTVAKACTSVVLFLLDIGAVPLLWPY